MKATQCSYRGTSPRRKRPHPQERHKALVLVLLQGSRGMALWRGIPSGLVHTDASAQGDPSEAGGGINTITAAMCMYVTHPHVLSSRLRGPTVGPEDLPRTSVGSNLSSRPLEGYSRTGVPRPKGNAHPPRTPLGPQA